ncbi:MAG: D-2-hydroxyacid dehydrogenase [Alphaproteobacteria bacterium]
MRGVFLDLATYTPDERHRALLEPVVDEWAFYDETASGEILARARGFDILVTNKCRITHEVLAGLPDLKFIVAGATGVDNIDVGAARERGVAVSNVRGYSTESVAQHTFMLILALCGSLIPYDETVRAGAWQSSKSFNVRMLPVTEVAGKVLGIMGHGDIGKAVERIAKAFGMKVLISARRGAEATDGRTAFEDVLKQADILSVHCPLTAETRGMIGVEQIARMKKGARIINVSRGGIVDEAALAEALKSGHIGGAGLDVLSQEPPTDGNVLLDGGIPNLIITPHTAWTSEEARLRMFEEIAANIQAFRNGQPQNLVI